VSAQEREWHPGDEVDLRGTIEQISTSGHLAWVTVSGGGVGVPLADLRPVSGGGEVEAATEAVIERAIAEHTFRGAHAGCAPAPGERPPIFSRCLCGWRSEEDHRAHVAEEVRKALAAAGLLVGGVPGRSEAEIKAEAWDEGVATSLEHAIRNDDGITLRLEHVDGSPWANPYRAARVAGTTEAGDDRA